MPVTEAIILAGGLGTRLRAAIPDLPKCMAPVNGRPFLAYVIKYLEEQGIEKFIFSLGYRSEAFTQFICESLPAGNYQLVVEDEPLGTGGAIRFAMQSAATEDVVVVNGDSICMADISSQAEFHQDRNAICTLALKPMKNFDRYGVVEMKPDHAIALFREKQMYTEGLINAGVYLINHKKFSALAFPEKFSFETEYLQKNCHSNSLYGFMQDGYFIDIGIPEDYQRAQKELIY